MHSPSACTVHIGLSIICVYKNEGLTLHSCPVSISCKRCVVSVLVLNFNLLNGSDPFYDILYERCIRWFAVIVVRTLLGNSGRIWCEASRVEHHLESRGLITSLLSQLPVLVG